jgi:hypothetical protein
MTDATKKVIVRKSSLPAVGDENEFYVRYRIVSEDKNRTSHWSPIYITESSPIEQVNGSISKSGNIIFCVWGDELLRPDYDVFVKNDSGSYAYHGTTQVHSYSFINQASSTVQVAIQVEGKNKNRSSSLTIFESSPFVI